VEEDVEHPLAEQLSLLEVTQPLQRPDVHLLNPDGIRHATITLKHHIWNDHFQVSENQQIIQMMMNHAETHTIQLANKGIRVLSAKKDVAKTVKLVGALNKDIEEVCSSIHRAILGVQALKAMLPEDKRTNLPDVEEFVWN
jgi:hypothetical protein